MLSPENSEVSSLLALDRLGRYEIRGELGRGTMGVVYRGYDPVIDRPVALKSVLLPPALPQAERERFLSRFMLEAKVAGKLIHPHIVVTYDATVDAASGLAFIAMELVEGESLARLQEVRGKLDWRRAVEIGNELARALDYAHRQGVVHRDVKPANVLLTAAGVAKLADFGIAKVAAAQLTQPGAVVGTPYFMSPEQIQGLEVDGRSDVFSLGAVLYLLVTGRRPFEGSDLAALANQVLYKSPPPASEVVTGIPHSLETVLERAMAKSPGNRYGSAGDLADSLAAVARGDEVRPATVTALGDKTVGPSIPARAPDREARRKPRSLVRRALLLGLVGAAAYLSWSPPARAKLASFLAPTRQVPVSGWERLERLYDRHRAEQEMSSARQARAGALLREGEEAEERGERQRAEALFEESLAISRQAGDGPGEASALLDLGRLRAHWGDPGKARADLASAEAVYRIYGDSSGQARALAEAGNLERDRGEPEKARVLYRKGMLLAERADDKHDKRAEASLHSEMALLALLNGELDDARSSLARARQVAATAGDAELEVSVVLRQAMLAYTEGELREVAPRAAEARRLCEIAGLEQRRARLELLEGWAAQESGDAEAARRHYDLAERQLRAGGDLPGLAAALSNRAALERSQGREAELRSRLSELSELRATLGFREPPLLASGSLGSGDEPTQRLARILSALPLTPLGEQALRRLSRPDPE